VAKLAGRLLALDLAGAVELRAGFNHKLTDAHGPGHIAAGDDFKTFGIDGTGKATADHHLAGFDVAFTDTLLTDRDFGVALNLALDVAVYMQIVGQGEVADQLGPCSNDGRSGTLAVLRMTSTNDSHSTRSSLVKSMS